MKFRCIFRGHSFRPVESRTFLQILVSLINEEFTQSVVLDKEFVTYVEEIARKYQRKYGNSAISDLICIKCGRRENCMEKVRKEMKLELENLLFAGAKKK